VLTVQICVGSSCFLRGAPAVINRMQELVEAHQLAGRLTLKGSFCMEQCTKGGVTMRLGDELLTGIKCEELPHLFETKILPALRG